MKATLFKVSKQQKRQNRTPKQTMLEKISKIAKRKTETAEANITEPMKATPPKTRPPHPSKTRGPQFGRESKKMQ